VQGYIVGVANAAGTITVFVYLHLTETHDSVVYLDAERLRVSPAQYADVEGDAIAFVESMGFMLENLNYQALPPEQQERLVKTLPCFLAEPQRAAAAAGGEPRSGSTRRRCAWRASWRRSERGTPTMGRRRDP
jgi:hypothetical protein